MVLEQMEQSIGKQVLKQQLLLQLIKKVIFVILQEELLQ